MKTIIELNENDIKEILAKEFNVKEKYDIILKTEKVTDCRDAYEQVVAKITIKP